MRRRPPGHDGKRGGGRMKIDLTLPEPPSSNRYYRTFHNRVVRSAEANKYRADVWAIVRREKLELAFPEATIRVEMRWYRSRKSGDLDNRAKVALDALNGLIWTDDKQIVELHLYRYEAPREGRLEMTVEAI